MNGLVGGLLTELRAYICLLSATRDFAEMVVIIIIIRNVKRHKQTQKSNILTY